MFKNVCFYVIKLMNFQGFLKKSVFVKIVEFFEEGIDTFVRQCISVIRTDLTLLIAFK